MSSSLRSSRPSSWRPSATVPAGLWDAKRELMVVNETLRWLHQHWDLTNARNANPEGSDAKARARMVAWRAVRPCLEPYFKEEQDVIANLVRVVDALAKRVDALSADYARLLGAVRADLVDAAGHFEDAIAGMGAGDSAGESAARGAPLVAGAASSAPDAGGSGAGGRGRRAARNGGAGAGGSAAAGRGADTDRA